ncbi:MAG: FHA domain-containing protein [Propionibacteriaceae bacterium]|nr:FHA domain-containing protein [Propionibacteriaceae bacterium]
MHELSRWVGGSCLCAVGRGGIALVVGDCRDLVEKLWEQLRCGTDLAGLLQLMAAEYATDLMHMPPFALVVHQERGVHVALRGPVRFVAATQDERVDIDAGNVVTWVERNLGPARGYQLVVEDAEGEALPIADGLVRVAAVYHGEVDGAEPPAPSLAQRRPEPPGKRPDRPPRSAELTLVHETVPGGAGEPGEDAEPSGGPAPEGPVADQPRPAGAGDPSPQAKYYAHHWEPTRAKPVEDAAVRDIRDDDRDPFAAPAPVAGRAAAATAPAEPAQPSPAGDITEIPPEDHGSFFIDAVPKPGDAAAPRGFAAPAPPPPPVPPRAQPPQPQAQASPAQPGRLGDHDGQTLTSARIAALRSERAAAAGGASASGQVLAGFCAAGHPNPPHAPQCRSCGQPLTERTGLIPTPPLGRIRVSTGLVIQLNSDVIVGRAPRVTPEPGRPAPQLVPVPSPEQQISRTHCEIRVDGWDIRALDKKSNNGTFLLRPGERPVRIDERTPTILRAGDVLDLGENVTLTLEFD